MYAIPKCGCTTLKTWFLTQEGKQHQIEKGVHKMISLYFGGDIPSETPVYKFTRSPITRIISAYREKIARADSDYHRDITFNEFLNELLADNANQAEWDSHWRPQCLFVNKRGAPATIFRMEDGMQRALDIISNNHNLPILDVGVCYATPSDIPMVVPTQEELDIIHTIYRGDFEAYYPELTT